MTDNGGRLRSLTAPSQATQACVICKTRKKKCSRSLPSCEYCNRKGFDCVYAPPPTAQRDAVPAESSHVAHIGVLPPFRGFASPRMILPAKSLSEQITTDAHQFSLPPEIDPFQVYLEVYNIIRATGQFVDGISARYFTGFHPHLPIISRIRFYERLITMGTAPAADFSVLLLTICLITHAPSLGYGPGNVPPTTIEQQSIYIATKSLLAKVQVSCPPSLHLIQAGLLLAVYEYTQGRSDDSFVTIAGIARIAYAKNMHTREHLGTQMALPDSESSESAILLKAEEEANTWWGIVIYERTFFNEVAVFDQPLVTKFPGRDARLPIESQVLNQLDILDPKSLPNVLVSSLVSPAIGGFGRTAQATHLLDQVFKAFETLDIDPRLLQLDGLDTDIQCFLSLIIPQCLVQSGVFCSAVNICIRALFTLHLHILHINPQAIKEDSKSSEEWHKRSQEALDTVTKMVIDIAKSLIVASPTNSATHIIDAMPPMYPYIARAALKHIHRSVQREDIGWLRSGEDALQESLHRYFHRWSVKM